MAVAASLVALLPAAAGGQQDLGHKTPGTLGLDAGSQALPGLYVVERALFYRARDLMDRDGHPLPVGMRLDAFGDGIGVVGVVEVPPIATYLTVAVVAPIAHVSLNTDRPEASVDRFGLGDLYVQPLKLGWRLPRLDLVAGYGFYVPTGRFEPGGQGGVGRGHWTHQLSAGGTVHVDRARTWSVSALASYDHNERKQGIDITRGDTVQLQGGAGKRLLRFVQVGVAGYALWQVGDDRGADLPPRLRGIRERVFGIGPELGVLVPPIRSRLSLRYERELAARARPEGQVFVLALTVLALAGDRPDGRSRE